MKDKIGLPVEEQQLIYSGKQLEDGKLLSEYPTLETRATIFLVGRLIGGAGSRMARVDRSVPTKVMPCPILLVDEECVKMPCGHYMSPDAVIHRAKSKIGAKERQISCPTCDKEWPIDVLKRYGGASKDELCELAEGLSINYCDTKLEIVQCPQCSSYGTRVDSSKTSVQCAACTKRLGKVYRFCFICLHDWANGYNEYNCGNAGCDDKVWRERILRDCPETETAYSQSKCPSIRQCPNPSCKLLIELAKGCKHMLCVSCKTEFCFVCLRQKDGDNWPSECGNYSSKCKPAPKQM